MCCKQGEQTDFDVVWLYYILYNMPTRNNSHPRQSSGKFFRKNLGPLTWFSEFLCCKSFLTSCFSLYLKFCVNISWRRRGVVRENFSWKVHNRAILCRFFFLSSVCSTFLACGWLERP